VWWRYGGGEKKRQAKKKPVDFLEAVSRVTTPRETAATPGSEKKEILQQYRWVSRQSVSES
jgi:hypothetical protein